MELKKHHKRSNIVAFSTTTSLTPMIVLTGKGGF